MRIRSVSVISIAATAIAFATPASAQWAGLGVPTPLTSGVPNGPVTGREYIQATCDPRHAAFTCPPGIGLGTSVTFPSQTVYIPINQFARAAEVVTLGNRIDGLTATVGGLEQAILQQGQALTGRIDELFRLRARDRRDMRSGIAAAVAIDAAPMPSAAGRTSYVLNAATFRGEQAMGGSIMHRLNTQTPFAISAGFAFGGNGNNAGKVGIAGEF